MIIFNPESQAAVEAALQAWQLATQRLAAMCSIVIATTSTVEGYALTRTELVEARTLERDAFSQFLDVTRRALE